MSFMIWLKDLAQNVQMGVIHIFRQNGCLWAYYSIWHNFLLQNLVSMCVIMLMLVHIYCVGGIFRQEKIFTYFATCSCWREFYPRIFLPCVNNYLHVEDIATFTVLVKIYSTKHFRNTKVAGLGEIFVFAYTIEYCYCTALIDDNYIRLCRLCVLIITDGCNRCISFLVLSGQSSSVIRFGVLNPQNRALVSFSSPSRTY